MATQILKVGSQFGGGVVKAVFKSGIMTMKGSYTRFYPKAEVEKELQKKEATK